MALLQSSPINTNRREESLGEADEDMPVYELTADPDDLNEMPQLMIPVLHIMVRVFLRCDLDEIVTEDFANAASSSTMPKYRIPWIFRVGQCHNGREVNLHMWPARDRSFAGFFWELKRCPDFARPLFDGGSLFNHAAEVRWRSLGAQTSALVEFVRETLSDVSCRRKVDNGSLRSFYLTVKRAPWDTSFFTGHQGGPIEAPSGVGYIGIQYDPPGKSRPLVPLVVTTTSQPLEATLSESICLMMSQLFMNLYRTDDPADKLRDQETFLIGLHGSRLYILRAWWPGLKTSAHWLHKEHELIIRRRVLHRRVRGDRKTPGRTRWVVDRESVYSVLDNILDDLGGEPDLSTFRAVTSREYDLWCEEDFFEAYKAVVALVKYLMSGKAKLGILQDAFEGCYGGYRRRKSDQDDDEGIEPIDGNEENGEEEASLQMQECKAPAGEHNGGHHDASETSTQTEPRELEISDGGHWMDPEAGVSESDDERDLTEWTLGA